MSTLNGLPPHAITATIAASGDTSGAVQIRGLHLCGIQMPAAFTGTGVSFLASADGVTYQPAYDSGGTLISATVAASRYIALNPAALAGIEYLKVKSNGTEAAERALVLMLRPFQ